MNLSDIPLKKPGDFLYAAEVNAIRNAAKQWQQWQQMQRGVDLNGPRVFGKVNKNTPRYFDVWSDEDIPPWSVFSFKAAPAMSPIINTPLPFTYVGKFNSDDTKRLSPVVLMTNDNLKINSNAGAGGLGKARIINGSDVFRLRSKVGDDADLIIGRYCGPTVDDYTFTKDGFGLVVINSADDIDDAGTKSFWVSRCDERLEYWGKITSQVAGGHYLVQLYVTQNADPTMVTELSDIDPVNAYCAQRTTATYAIDTWVKIYGDVRSGKWLVDTFASCTE
jgi:hypothetical protein